MKKSIFILAIMLICTIAFAGRHKSSSGGHSRRSTSHKKNDFGNNGRYIGGHGSSHYGGSYHSRIGNGDHYKRKKK